MAKHLLDIPSEFLKMIVYQVDVRSTTRFGQCNQQTLESAEPPLDISA